MAEQRSAEPKRTSPEVSGHPSPTPRPEEIAAYLEAAIDTLPTELLCRLASLLDQAVQDRALRHEAHEVPTQDYYRTLERDNEANRNDPDYPFK